MVYFVETCVITACVMHIVGRRAVALRVSKKKQACNVWKLSEWSTQLTVDSLSPTSRNGTSHSSIWTAMEWSSGNNATGIRVLHNPPEFGLFVLLRTFGTLDATSLH